jgi:hypothetical protein
MKRVFSLVLCLLALAPKIVADCTPSGTNLRENYSISCPLSITKNVVWSIEWPDMYIEHINPSGTGVCTMNNL